MGAVTDGSSNGDRVKPFPVILSAPSGGGKTTIVRRLLEVRDDIGCSVSATTRRPRVGEVNGVAYHFLSPDQFATAVGRNEFAEYAEVHGNMYGTLRREVDRVLDAGQHVLMAIDVQGATQFAAAFPEAVQIFVLPPSGRALIERLVTRGTESQDTIARRLRNALTELEVVSQYEYVVVNDELERAVADVSGIIDAESMRRERSTTLSGLVADIVGALKRELSHYSGEEVYARTHA